MELKRCYHLTGNFFHFSSHVFVPEVNSRQLVVKPKEISVLLDDIWCWRNKTNWECPLLPDWASKTNFVCNSNSSCIEHCSLHVKSDLPKYLVYAGSIIILSIIIVHMVGFYKKKIIKKIF